MTRQNFTRPYRLLKPILLSALMVFSVSAAHAQRGPSSVFVETVQTKEFATRIEALGTLEPNEVVDLTLNTADRVQSIYFDDGERVRKGKTLLSLAQREQIALTEGAEATAEEARRQLERIERLVTLKAVSQSELDEAQRNVDAANAQLRAVQSRQKDRVLVAPFDGILGFRQVSVGSFVRPGDVVARLIDDSEMNLQFSVPSTFLRTLRPGTKISARTDDLPGMIFDGEIATLDNAIDPVTRAVSVRATIPNPDRLLLSGMFMEIVLTADPRKSLAIPEEAVQPVGPKTFVFVIEDNDGELLAKRAEVKLGALQDGYRELRSGLDPGARVVTEGIIRIRDGSAVKIEDKSILKPMSGRSNNGGSGGGGMSSASGR